MKTFLSLVTAGGGGCSTLLAIPAARRRGTRSRGEISQGFALSRSEYGGLGFPGKLGFRDPGGGGGVGGGDGPARRGGDEGLELVCCLGQPSPSIYEREGQP